MNNNIAIVVVGALFIFVSNGQVLKADKQIHQETTDIAFDVMSERHKDKPEFNKGTVAERNMLIRIKTRDEGDARIFNVDELGKHVAEASTANLAAAVVGRGFVGKFERALADRLTQRDSTPLGVVFLLRTPDSGAVTQGDLAGMARSMIQVQDGLVRALAQDGQARIRYRARYAPMMVVSASAAAVQAAATRPEVERVYLERISQPRLGVSKIVTQAAAVHQRGITGNDVKVGVVERGRIGNAPDLPTTQRILCRPEATTEVSSHKTEVAGVIQSTQSVNTGQAPRVTIVDGIAADFSDAEIMAATDCVIGQGAYIINMSFGYDTFGEFTALSRYVDATAFNTRRTFVVAVSNFCTNPMGAPEVAFNDLSVGSFSDRRTPGFADDVHGCSSTLAPHLRHSAFLNPLSLMGDRQQPDVVAPGHSIRTTLPGGSFATVTGTSFAAPHVAGLAALLQDRDDPLIGQSERLRAIIMASARHNIEGDSRLSDQDGAGAILAAAADRVLLNNQSWFFRTAGGPAGFPRNQVFTANAGEKVRVALVWAHKYPRGATMTEPTTDLDLEVLSPGGALVGFSESYDNTFEIVEFTAPVTGSYAAGIDNLSPSIGTEYVGLAVSRSDN